MAATETESEVTAEEGGKQPLQIDVKIDVTSTCERHVVVTVPGAEVERYRREAFDEVTPKAELPGFRAGKAPRKLVESRFKEQVAEQVKSSLVMDSLQQITDGDHFSAISEPDFDYEAVTLPAEGDFKYEFRIEVRPDFETPKWEGLSLVRPSCELTDKHVDEHLSRTLKRFMPGEAVDGAVEMGDLVTLNATFSHNGKQVSHFEEEETTVCKTLKFGDAVVDNFGELIVGKSEGDTFTATVTLSEDAAAEELRGKEIDVEFEIHEVKRILVDEIGPAALADLGFDDTSELRSFVRSELERQFEYHQQQALRKQIIEQLTKDANWDMPESLVRRQTNRELQRMVLELQRSGFNQQQINSYLNASRLNARQTTISALREHFVLEKIAEDLNVEPSAEDYDKEIELIAEQNDSSVRRIRARLEKSGQMDAIRNQIIERQVIGRITEAGNVSEEEDLSFLKSDPEASDIDFAIAGDYQDIPDAKHDNEPAQVPGAPKLPGKEKEGE
ncbi:MAG: trigger factor [Planctomycetales bacterium]|nr:trigger factor [Planctomycetales bacterium]